MAPSLIEKCRDKQARILRTVKDICDSNGINMILLGDAAYAVYRGIRDADDIPVCIDASDARKFISAFEQSGTDLVLDGMHDNPEFPYFEFRVYDTSTLDFTISDFRKYRYNCIYVRILFIRHIPASRFKAAYLRSIENAFNIKTQLDHGNIYENASRMAKLMQSQQKRKGRDWLAEKVFDTLADGYSGDTKEVVVSGRTYDASMFLKPVKATSNGVEYNIPSKTDKYFRSVYGLNWKEHVIDPLTDSNARFRDPDHSWEEFRKRIDYMDFDGYDKTLKEYRDITSEFSGYNRNVAKYRSILRRTDMRFRMWQKYMPMKDELMELYRRGDYEELGEILREYMDDLMWCKRHNLGLCFDEDILNITLDVFRHKGAEEDAAQMDELVPAEHREVLRIMDNKGRIIE